MSPLVVTTNELINENATTTTTTTNTATHTKDNSMINLEKENLSEKVGDQMPEIEKVC